LIGFIVNELMKLILTVIRRKSFNVVVFLMARIS